MVTLAPFCIMIKITKATSNEVILTLKEKQTIDNATFLFNFRHDNTKQEKAFLAADTSSFKNRFNRFTIEENASETLSSGIVSLREGFHTYEVYEQSSTSNLNVQEATNLVPIEVGKVQVIGTVTTIAEYDEQDKEYIEYES